MPFMYMPLSDRMKDLIDAMDHTEMLWRWWHDPERSVYFTEGPIYDYFMARFERLGGWDGRIKEIPARRPKRIA